MIETRPFPGGFGAEVRGISPDRPPDADCLAELHRLWIDHGILLFRGMGTSERALVDVSRWFGEPEIHPVNANLLTETPEVLDISYHPPAGEGDLSQPVYEVDGQRLASWLPWHSDLVYMPAINHGGILRAVAVPSRLGETGFIDQIAAYAALPNRLKERIQDLYVVYQLSTRMEAQRFNGYSPIPIAPAKVAAGIEARVAAGAFPKVAHPMVFTQVETGRQVLNVSPTFALGIEGMPGEQGDALLREVIGHMLREEFMYFHEWQVDDLVLFDNWRVAHQANGLDPAETRVMQRTTISGDYALGRLAS